MKIVLCVYVLFLIFIFYRLIYLFIYFCCSSSSSSLCMHSNSITFHHSHYDIWTLEAHILSCCQPSERHTNLCICRIAGHRCLVTFLFISLILKCQDCLSGFSVIFAELAYLYSCNDLIAHIYKLASVEPPEKNYICDFPSV